MLAVHHEAPCLEVVEEAVGRPCPGTGPAVRDAPPRDVGLREDCDLDLGEDEPGGDRRRHHAGPRGARRGGENGRVHAFGRQRGGQPPRPRHGGGTQRDRVALSHQSRDPGCEARRVACHRVETTHREYGHVRAFGNRRQRCDTGRALAEQTLEGHVQPGEAFLVPLLRAPGRGERLGERGLLVEQLTPRSRIRRGSTRTTCAPAGKRSGSTRAVSSRKGSHDSMPSNCVPSARLSHTDAPQGRRATSADAASRKAGVTTSSATPIERDGT